MWAHMSSSVYESSGKAPTSLIESSAVRRVMMSMSPSVSNRAASSCAGRLTISRSAASPSGGTSICWRALNSGVVVLQMAEEVGAHAHDGAQARVRQRLREQLGKAPALALLGAHVELLALVDIEKKGRRLGLIELLAAALGRVDQIAERRFAVAQELDQAVLLLDPLEIGGGELPGVEERFHQRLERVGAGLERQKAPLAAVPKGGGPGIGGARLLRPAWRWSAASTPACASEDFPTPELPISTGSRSGAAARAESTSTVSRLRPKK